MNFKEQAEKIYSEKLNGWDGRNKIVNVIAQALEEAYLAGQNSKKIVAVKTEKPIEKQNNFVYDGLGNRRRPDWPY